MALSYHQRLIDKIRSALANLLVSYDPFADKLLERFRANPHHPFTQTQPFTFEYRYRRWSTIYFVIVLQILTVLLTIYTFARLRSDEYWLAGSAYLVLLVFALLSAFLGLNLAQNLKQRHVLLSLLDLRVSIYVNNVLTHQCPIDRAYVCLCRVKSYGILLHQLVFVIEDMESIAITDYFIPKLPLRKIGKCLAQNLFVGYIESETWTGVFPKYTQLRRTIHRQRHPSENETSRSSRTHPSHTTLDL